MTMSLHDLNDITSDPDLWIAHRKELFGSHGFAQPKLGRALAVAREHAGWLQSQAAKEIGISKWLLSRIERGVEWPSLATWDRIETAYGQHLYNVMPFTMLWDVDHEEDA